MNNKQLEDALKYAKHSLYLSGMDVIPEDEKAVRVVLTGKMTHGMLIKALRISSETQK